MLGLKLSHVSERGYWWHQAITCTNSDLLLIEPLNTTSYKIRIQMQWFTKKVHLKLPSAQPRADEVLKFIKVI